MPRKSSHNQVGVRNPYLTLDKKYKTEQPTWGPIATENHIGPGRYECVGLPGSMKSAWLYCLLVDIITLPRIDNLILCAASLDQDNLYKDLKEKCKKHKIKGLFSHTIDDLCACDKNQKLMEGRAGDDDEEDGEACDKLHVTDFKPDEVSILVCDDLVSKKPSELKRLQSFWVMGRRCGLSSIFITQNETAVDITLRRCCDYRIIKSRGMQRDDLSRLLLSLFPKNDLPNILALWDKICNFGAGDEYKTQFLLLQPTHPNPLLRVRWNYQETDVGLK